MCHTFGMYLFVQLHNHFILRTLEYQLIYILHYVYSPLQEKSLELQNSYYAISFAQTFKMKTMNKVNIHSSIQMPLFTDLKINLPAQ